nr:protein phosphatase 2C 37-like [Ipomoea batatas]
MAAVCGGETEATTPVEPSSEGARRRRMEIHKFRFVAADVAVAPPLDNERKRHNNIFPVSPPASESCDVSENCKKRRKLEGNDVCYVSKACEDEGFVVEGEIRAKVSSEDPTEDPDRPESATCSGTEPDCPKFGMTSVCGRRRDMEDAVAIHPFFRRNTENSTSSSHFFGVYDGHGCSHVAMKCRDRMHEIVQSDVGGEEPEWKEVMSRSFSKMDQEITDWSSGANAAAAAARSSCRCELQTPQCDAVGSTAVVAVVTPESIVVSNCGDSRAVLCRNGVAIPLSIDHKPDRPDEVNRIEAAGGRVIYWDGPRVLGVLAMSRAIGDNYLKPYVISEPEVTVTERTAEDECLILASDGLWDVVSNETACGVARMCLRQGKPPSPPRSPGRDDAVTAAAGESSDKACSDASILLTKLALARYSSDNISVVVVDLRRNP